jgi:uncharacterized protein YecE (DUF72 family)
MEWYIGTMGFSYAAWNGVFYPREMKSNQYLAYYSRIFNAVEVDSTFYGTPRPAAVKRWAAVTPDGFRFCLKVPRLITHDKALLGIEDDLEQFLDVVSELGDKLGALLFQFPPSFTAAGLPGLEETLALLPRDRCFAVEVRDSSWYAPLEPGEEPPLAPTLRRYNVAWTATQYPDLPAIIFRTAPFLYIRWIGQHGTFDYHNSERIDRQAQLQEWLELIQANPADELYGFTNNDYAGFAAGTANRFKRLAGLPFKTFDQPQQPNLL